MKTMIGTHSNGDPNDDHGIVHDSIGFSYDDRDNNK